MKGYGERKLTRDNLLAYVAYRSGKAERAARIARRKSLLWMWATSPYKKTLIEMVTIPNNKLEYALKKLVA